MKDKLQNLELVNDELINDIQGKLRELRRLLWSADYMKNLLQKKVEKYDGSPRDLLITCSNLLGAVAATTRDPNAKRVHSDFYKAATSYLNADVADLGEAFNLQRPKNWSQAAEKFWMQKMAGIEIEIDDLRAEMPVMDAIANVANKHCKGVSKIRDDYYSYKKVMLPFRCEKLDRLEARYYGTKGFNCDGKPFCQRISSDSGKLECERLGIYYKPLMKILEKNDWEPNPIPE